MNRHVAVPELSSRQGATARAAAAACRRLPPACPAKARLQAPALHPRINAHSSQQPEGEDAEQQFGDGDVDVFEGDGDGGAGGAHGQQQRERITTRYLTKYERARVLGTRALQIRCVPAVAWAWAARGTGKVERATLRLVQARGRGGARW